MTPQEFRHLDEASIEELRATGVNAVPFEKQYIRKDGTRVPVLVAGAMLDEARCNGVAFVLDLSARQEAEQALSRSHEFLAKVMDNVSNAVAVFDSQGRFVRVNDCVTELTGYAAEELLGRHFDCLYDEPVRPALLALFERVSRLGERVLGHEVPLRRKDGVQRLIALNAVLVPGGGSEDSGGNAVVATAEDITERRHAEDALRSSEVRFREAFAHAPVGMVLKSLNGHFLHVNPAYCEIVGYSAEELLHPDFNFLQLIDPADREHNAHEFQRLLSGEIPAYFLEKRYIRKDGRRVWVRASASLRRDEEGRPLQVVSLIEDIDARRKGEEDHLILEAMMEHIPLGITIADAPDVHIRTVSRFGRELLDRPAHELVDIVAEEHVQSWHVLRADGTPPGTAEELPLTRAIRHGEIVREEEWIVERADGSRVPILCTAAPICDAQENVIAGVIGWQDISMRKAVERSLQRMNAELEEFAFVASHDLKAPLRAVEGLASWIAEDAGDCLSGENRKRLRLMRDRLVHMNRLIEGLLAFARLGGAAKPQRENVALMPLLQEVVGELSVPAGFQVVLQEPFPMLQADSLQVRRIFQNLIGNAIHHHDGPAAGHVWVRTQDGGDHWLIDVADDGPGIPPGERERVFKMFVTSDSGGHTGIGLAVVRQIIRSNGGQIEVTDNAPRGALFRIRWPK